VALIPSNSEGHSARSSIPWIRDALKFQTTELQKLCSEMKSFVGLSETEKSSLRLEIEDQRLAHASKSPDSVLNDLFDQQFNLRSEFQFVFRD
jgi:hypothetical protein